MMTINTTIVLKLINDIGADATARALKVFLVEIDSNVRDIRTSLDESEFDSIAKLAHTLKSTSATFGAVSLNDIALEVEVAAKSRDPAALLRLVDALELCARDTKPLYKTHTD